VKPFLHSKKCVNKWGGVVEDYQVIHDWFDKSSIAHGDVRHRSILHHTFGIHLCEQVFGTNIKISTGKLVSVRDIAELHIMDDLGRIPSPGDYLNNMTLQDWMGGKKRKTKRITW
jgi:hypothetical protein